MHLQYCRNQRSGPLIEHLWSHGLLQTSSELKFSPRVLVVLPGWRLVVNLGRGLVLEVIVLLQYDVLMQQSRYATRRWRLSDLLLSVGLLLVCKCKDQGLDPCRKVLKSFCLRHLIHPPPYN